MMKKGLKEEIVSRQKRTRKYRKNVNQPSVCGVGYIGEGNFTPKTNVEIYKKWVSMLMRCYSAKFKEAHPTYQDAMCDPSWHNFQVFAQWWEDNYYSVEEERMELDKDIKIKGNKIYGPETCLIVPKSINTLFVKCDARRGQLPIGLRLDPSSKKNPYMAKCCSGGKQVYLGNYDNPNTAFNTYKKYKENLIKKIANQFKHSITEELYGAMVAYKVEITD